jgi:hypothetical protein
MNRYQAQDPHFAGSVRQSFGNRGGDWPDQSVQPDGLSR